jgi:hypothetical protein
LEKRLSEMRFWIFYLWGLPFYKIALDYLLSHVFKMKESIPFMWNDLLNSVVVTLFFEGILIPTYFILRRSNKKGQQFTK